MMKMVRWLPAAVIFLSLGTSLFAEEAEYVDETKKREPHCGVCEFAEADRYVKSAPGKILRGVTNAGLGWTNLFARPKESVQEGENILIGIGKGLFQTLGRTIQGALEIAVFWLPPAEEEPLRNCALGDLGWTGR